MSKLEEIATKISELKRGGVHTMETDTLTFFNLVGSAFLQMDEYFKELGQESDLEKIATDIKNIRYNASSNLMLTYLRDFFGLVGNAFGEVDKSLSAINKVASSNATQKTVEQVANNQKQR